MTALFEGTLAEYRIFDIRILPTIDYESDLEWICKSFGFLEPRDKKKTAYRIFKEIVEAARDNRGLTSDELAQNLNLTRGTIIHHLNKMIKSGLVIHQEGRYKLRGRSLTNTVEEIERDIHRVFENIHKVAKTIDDTLGLFFRQEVPPRKRSI